MFSRAASTFARTSARRVRRGPASTTTVTRTGQRRAMGGGGHAMEGSSAMMENAAEVFGVICWLWVFSRARADLPWILGFRHPWDHVEDPFAPSDHSDHGHGHGHSSTKEENVEAWEKFTRKAVRPGEDDDDDDEEEEGDDDEDDEE